MNMDKLIKRINFLYKKSKSTKLSNDELCEQKKLRQEYIDAVKGNLRKQLEGIKRVPSKNKLNWGE